MDDGQVLDDEADEPAWLQQNCNARMLVGRGVVATVLVNAGAEEEEEEEEGETEAAG